MDERGVEEDLTQQLVWEFRNGLIAHRDIDSARQLLPGWMRRKIVESKMNDNATSWSLSHDFVPSPTGSFRKVLSSASIHSLILEDTV
jgi:hypothetical protein